MSNFLKNVIKETKNEYGTIVSDGLATADVSGYVDTGSYIFNALCSGSLYGGLPQNKITAIAGESATGKTFFVLGVCKAFLDWTFKRELTSSTKPSSIIISTRLLIRSYNIFLSVFSPILMISNGRDFILYDLNDERFFPVSR